MSTCFMAGHAQVEERLLPQIYEVAQRLIDQWGVTRFVVGRYGAFDRLAAQTVMQLKQQYPQIELILLLPYYFREIQQEVPKGFDGTLYPEGLEKVPYRYAIVQANRLAVDGATHFIVYQRYSIGNTYRLTKYAQRAERKGRLHIWRVGEEM